ncbi:helix-turn-helix domain-containing protein [Curtobacterium sp. 24E2]|nr:helix-turn-helix transcriptional regulator [Curtobacterium sp. 24E2]
MSMNMAGGPTTQGAGETFARRRRSQRVSTADIAARAGLPEHVLIAFEAGYQDVSLGIFTQLVAAIGLDLVEYFAPTVSAPAATARSYRFHGAFDIEPGFRVTGADVVEAVLDADVTLAALPRSLFRTLDLKTQSSMVGSVFVAALAARTSSIVNPIEKGHPDILPTVAANCTEAELRNYPSGLEVKTTVGSVEQGSALDNGTARVAALRGIGWQAHHRGVRALMALVWDFVDGTEDDPGYPVITAVFHSGSLVETDWGAISGTTGRNTKVTQMLRSGAHKMASGAIALIDRDDYRNRYEKVLPEPVFDRLLERASSAVESER